MGNHKNKNVLGMDRYIHIILVCRIEEEHGARIEIYLFLGSSLSISLSKPGDSLKKFSG